MTNIEVSLSVNFAVSPMQSQCNTHAASDSPVYDILMPVPGPGAFDFKQGDTSGTIFWKIVGHFLKDPSAEQTACQAPKPILLDTGSVHLPYEWCALIVTPRTSPALTCVL